MGWIIDLSARSGDVHRFDEGLKKAKNGLMEVCDIWESMKQDFQMRGDYNQRYHEGWNQPTMSERDWQELQERRRRDGHYM